MMSVETWSPGAPPIGHGPGHNPECDIGLFTEGGFVQPRVWTWRPLSNVCVGCRDDSIGPFHWLIKSCLEYAIPERQYHPMHNHLVLLRILVLHSFPHYISLPLFSQCLTHPTPLHIL